MKLNPMFRPPADFVRTKPHRKLYIPTEEYPGYNFIGEARLVLGGILCARSGCRSCVVAEGMGASQVGCGLLR